MAYNTPQFKQSLKNIEEWLKGEFSGSRANPSILDGVKVEAYGAEMPINQVANVSVEDARMIRITPWDMSQAKSIEKAIMISDLGLSVTVDDKGLRIVFPDLTADRRAALIKIAKQKLEDAKVSFRSEREKSIKEIDAAEKAKEISEDEKFRMKADLQKVLEDATRVLDEIFSKKEKEISE